jgi:hypothetical protein
MTEETVRKGPDFNAVIATAKSVMLDPGSFWEKASSDTDSITAIYMNYLVYIAGIAALGQFLQFVSFGFVSALMLAIVFWACSLAAIYVVSLAARWLARKYDGNTTQENALRWIGYSWTPSCIGSALGFLPGIGWLVGLAGGVYGIYVSWIGISDMMKVSQDKHLVFYLSLIVAMIFIGVLFSVMLMFLGLSATVSGAL